MDIRKEGAEGNQEIDYRNHEGGAEEQPAGPADDKEEAGPKMHAGRIIVRNIGFDITEKHLRKDFAKYGAINEINVPLKSGSKLNRGFAFIEYSNKD